MANKAQNPYVGPVAFTEKDRAKLFGRGADLKRLMILTVAQRIILIYSPSGAGKTSLLQAKLVPALKQKGFDVQPIIRMNHEPEEGTQVTNRHIYSMIVSLEGAVMQDDKTGAGEKNPTPLEILWGQEDEKLAARGRIHLKTYWQIRRKDEADLGGNKRVALIFDQFEEILTTNPHAYDEKIEFFEQLGSMLQEDTRLWAIFAMREDYLAEIDPFRHLIPSELRQSYRLDLLSTDQARRAIVGPAEGVDVTFSDEAADKLVYELSLMKTRTGEAQPGRHVEPVQLQVVCDRLWYKLQPEEGATIPAEAVSAEGHIDEALSGYYNDNVERVASGDEDAERQIRDFFDQKLINEQGIRRQVMDSEVRLGAEVVSALIAAHLIRAEERRGLKWFELSHDRLVRPVMRCNEEWFENHRNLLEDRAEVWRRTGDVTLFFQGEELSKWEAWSEAQAAKGNILRDHEKEFLERSRRQEEELLIKESEEKARQERRTRRIISGFLGVVVIGLVVATILAIVAFGQSKRAKEAESDANVAQATAEAAAKAEALERAKAEDAAEAEKEERAKAEMAEAQAVTAAEEARRARVNAENIRDQARLTESRRLAAISADLQEADRPQIALLLAWEAVKTAPEDGRRDIREDELKRALQTIEFNAQSTAGDTKIELESIEIPLSWLDDPCQKATGNLTQDEWDRYFGVTVPYRKTCEYLPEHATAREKRLTSDDIEFLSNHCEPGGYLGRVASTTYEEVCARAVDIASDPPVLDTLRSICEAGTDRIGTSSAIQRACQLAVELAEAEVPRDFETMAAICLAGAEGAGSNVYLTRACEVTRQELENLTGMRFGSETWTSVLDMCQADLEAGIANGTGRRACSLITQFVEQALAEPARNFDDLADLCSIKLLPEKVAGIIKQACQTAVAQAADFVQNLQLCRDGITHPILGAIVEPACQAAETQFGTMDSVPRETGPSLQSLCEMSGTEQPYQDTLRAICSLAVDYAARMPSGDLSRYLCDAGQAGPGVQAIVQKSCDQRLEEDPQLASQQCQASLEAGEGNVAACTATINHRIEDDLRYALDTCNEISVASETLFDALSPLCLSILDDIFAQAESDMEYEAFDICFIGLEEQIDRDVGTPLPAAIEESCGITIEAAEANGDLDVLWYMCDFSSGADQLAQFGEGVCQRIDSLTEESEDPVLLANLCSGRFLADVTVDQAAVCGRAAEFAVAAEDLGPVLQICQAGQDSPAVAELVRPACDHFVAQSQSSEDVYSLSDACMMTFTDETVAAAAEAACGRAAALASEQADLQLLAGLCQFGAYNEAVSDMVQPACLALDNLVQDTDISEPETYWILYDACRSAIWDEPIAGSLERLCDRAIILAVEANDYDVVYDACLWSALPDLLPQVAVPACRQFAELANAQQDAALLLNFCNRASLDDELNQVFEDMCEQGSVLAGESEDALLNFRLCQNSGLDVTLPEVASQVAAQGPAGNCAQVIELATRIFPGDSVTGHVPSGGGEAYWFEGQTGQRVFISLSADNSDLDSYVFLGGPGGFLVEDDDGGAGLNSRLEAELPDDGVYVIFARGYDDQSSGNFRLTFE